VGANWAGVWTSIFDPSYSKSAGCGSCHISAGPDALPVTPQGAPVAADDSAKDQIDCVVCHGQTYNGGGTDGDRVVLTSADGRSYWGPAALEDAKTVGGTISSEACKRCHINSGGKVFSPYGTLSKAFKYGTDFVPEPYELTYDVGDGTQETATIDGDVHAARGVTCADCHAIGDHKVRYGHHNVSWANDVVPDDFNCATCHGDAPHAASDNPNKQALDGHAAYLACQTCHIRSTGGLMKRDMRYPIAPEGDEHFYHFKDEVRYGLAPEYRWFNGTSGGWEGVLEGPCPIGPRGSKQGYRQGDGSKITPFKRYEAMLWFDILVGQPVPYILKDFFVDGDLTAAANKGMDASGWLPPGSPPYDFELRRGLGFVFGFPMICGLKLDHGVQTGAKALGYDTQSCNSCHSSDSAFWTYLGYSDRELQQLQQPR